MFNTEKDSSLFLDKQVWCFSIIFFFGVLLGENTLFSTYVNTVLHAGRKNMVKIDPVLRGLNKFNG
jgi:hypothetical protein